MKVPETPIEPLRTDAKLADIIAKVNELIEAVNGMWNPQDGSTP